MTPSMPVSGAILPHERRADIDALRVGALLLLILYHLLLIYSGLDVWRVNAHQGYWADYIITLLRPWRLALVFFVGGVAVRFMLEKKPFGSFMADRASKLLTAFVFAVIVLVPPQRYVRLDEAGQATPGYLDYLLHRAPYVETSLGFPLPEFSHAWFLPYLFFYSAIAALLWRFLPRLFGAMQRAVESAPALLIVAAAALWFSLFTAAIEPTHPPTNMLVDDLIGHLRWGIVFLAGVLLGRSAAFWAKLDAQKWRIWLAMALLTPLNVGLLWLHLHDVMQDPAMWRAVRGFYGGVALFGILAFAHWAVRKPSPALRYASDAILPVYLLHQTCLVMAADIVVKLEWPAPIEFTVLLVATMLIPITIYQLFVRHWMPVRVLFGLRPKHREPPPSPRAAAPPVAASGSP
ncbi:MAG TPA: acyltransferase [Candidatus Binatia bacterium]|nr:acyltransferase [Candidatus Binatia bacterium]